MGKLTVPRPSVREKLQVEEIALDADELEEVDITEPSGPPVFDAPAPAPVIVSPPPPPMRPLAASLSEFELDSIRKSSPPVLERRKQLQKIVASAVGVAWFMCIAALGETALRSLLALK